MISSSRKRRDAEPDRGAEPHRRRAGDVGTTLKQRPLKVAFYLPGIRQRRYRPRPGQRFKRCTDLRATRR